MERGTRSINRALVTGARGFIASHLILKLAARRYTVSLLDLKDEQDILSPAFDEALESEPDVIFNLAGEIRVPPSQEDPLRYWRNNTLAAIHVFREARRRGIRVIHASTAAAVYGESHYALSKRAAEEAAAMERQLGADIVILRIFNVYGPRQPDDFVVPRFLSLAMDGKPITLHNKGVQERDYIYVEDVAQSLLDAVGTNKNLIEVGTGVTTSVKTVANLAFEIAGREPTFEFVENARPLEAATAASFETTLSQLCKDWYQTAHESCTGCDCGCHSPSTSNGYLDLRRGMVKTYEYLHSLRSY